MPGNKRPVSVLVLIHNPALDILLLERAGYPDYWQSVTGSQEGQEGLRHTAQREVREETGITAALADLQDWQLSNCFEIFPQWRERYPAGVTHNIEHVYSLCVPAGSIVQTAAAEHGRWQWLPCQEAAGAVFSWSNRDAILMLPHRQKMTQNS